MQKNYLMMLLASSVLIAGIFIAGCTDSSSSVQTTDTLSAVPTVAHPADKAQTGDSGQQPAFNQSATPAGTPPDGLQMNGTMPSGTPPGGMMANGTRPQGGPGGMEMNGTRPSGTPPDGMQGGNGEGPSGTPPSST